MSEPSDPTNEQLNNTTTPPPATPSTVLRPIKRRRWPVLLVIAFFALFIMGAGGFFVATALEEQDSFCISCHTTPEVTYYNRAYMSLDNPDQPVTDLATAHYHLSKIHDKGDFACINCHRGDSSLSQRISTLALGGRDALIYVAGKEDPTIEKTQTREGWLPNAACTSCHADTLLALKGLDNHFHNHLPQAKTALDNGGKLTVPDSLKNRESTLLRGGLRTVNTSLICTDCHQAHVIVPNGAVNFFMEKERRAKACVTCHIDAKEGPQDVQNLQ